MQRRIILSVVLSALLFSAQAQAKESRVVATIKPLHSLVALVMEGSGDTPMLLVDGKTSPHTFTLKPSQVAALQKADIIFMVGDDFELFMRKVLPSLPKKVMCVAMDKETQLNLQPVRQGKDFDLSEHSGEAEHESSQDLHYWMRMENTQAMVMEIARQLAIVYPGNRTIYFDNAKKINSRLQQFHKDLELRMVPLRGKPFIVFHDAYQYFENDYGLKAAGSIMLRPDQAPGAKHMDEIRKKIKKLGAACVFHEPSFDGKIVDNLLEGTKAKSGVLDPEGALLTPGPELYFQLMERIASGLEKCLLPSP